MGKAKAASPCRTRPSPKWGSLTWGCLKDEEAGPPSIDGIKEDKASKKSTPTKKHCWRHSSSFRARLEEIVALVMIEEPKFISATIFAPNTMSAGWSEAGGCRACHGTDRGVGYNNHQGGLWSLARPSLEVQAQNEVEECVQVARSRRSNDYEGTSPWSLLTLLY